MNNVKYERELYPPMCEWLEIYLKEKYRRQSCEIIVVDCHSEYLDSILSSQGVISDFPQL